MTSVEMGTLITPESRPLALAAAIVREHEAAYGAARSALEHARRAGELLIEAKAQLQHGAWLPWLREYCPPIAERTAQAYMRLARQWPELEARWKSATVADLPLRDALKLLAEPRESSDSPVDVDRYLYGERPREPREIEIPIDAVGFRRDLYPRRQFVPALIDRYAEFLADLPPIEVNQDHELIDGWHRLEAHRKAGATTIRVVVTQVATDIEHLELAARRNSTHGEQLPLRQERTARERHGPSWKEHRQEEHRIRTELEGLRQALNAPNVTSQELITIRDRAGELSRHVLEWQMQATREVGRLAQAQPWLLDYVDTPGGLEAFIDACETRITELEVIEANEVHG